MQQLHAAPPGYFQGAGGLEAQQQQFQQPMFYVQAAPTFYAPPGWAPGAPAPQADSGSQRGVPEQLGQQLQLAARAGHSGDVCTR